MNDSADSIDGGPVEQQGEIHHSDHDLERKVKAIQAMGKRDRDDSKYNVLNAAVWHAHAGHLSNRITDLEAYFGPMSDLLDSFRGVARDADNATELMSILEKVEAYNKDAKRYAEELRKLANAVDSELGWYTDENFREWGRMEPKESDDGDREATLQ